MIEEQLRIAEEALSDKTKRSRAGFSSSPTPDPRADQPSNRDLGSTKKKFSLLAEYSDKFISKNGLDTAKFLRNYPVQNSRGCGCITVEITCIQLNLKLGCESLSWEQTLLGTLSQEFVMLFVLSFFFFTTGNFPGLYISGLKVCQQAQSFPLAPRRDPWFGTSLFPFLPPIFAPRLQFCRLGKKLGLLTC